MHLSPVRGLYTERGRILAKFSFILRKVKRGRSRTFRTWKTELNALSFVVLSFVLKVVLPNNKFYVSEKSVLPNILWSMLTKLLWSVRRSLLNKGQWRKKWMTDSTSLPQLHIGQVVSWKLCLNLCSRMWLRPSRSSVICLIPIGLCKAKSQLEEGCMNFVKTL